MLGSLGLAKYEADSNNMVFVPDVHWPGFVVPNPYFDTHTQIYVSQIWQGLVVRDKKKVPHLDPLVGSQGCFGPL